MKRTSLFVLSLCLAVLTAPGVAQYCTSTATATNCGNAEEYIGNVTIGSLNNSSTCLSAPAYENYTGLAGPVIPQASGTAIVVTVGNWYSSTDTVTVFCDWNGNSVLNDSGEVYPLVQGVGNSGGNTLYSGTITPPPTAVASTRMRVKTVYGSSANPCGTSTWSNTEDYTIGTLPPSGLVAAGSASPSPATAGSPTLFTVAVSATSPPNPPVGVNVGINLSSIGGSSAQLMYDDGVTGGDVTAGDLVFSWTHAPSTNGNAVLQFTAVDNIPRTVNGTISLAIYPSNDACASSITIGLGANGPFTNVYATDSGVIGSCGLGYKDVWYTFSPPCSGPYNINTCSSALFDTVLVVFDACGGNELGCNDDGGVGCGYTSNIASINLTAGLPIMIRVASYSSTAVGTFLLNVNQLFTTTWSSPAGPGSLAFTLTGGPLSGSYYHAITLAPGNYPNGWLFGVDITLPDIVNQISFGWPFVGSLDFCGNAFAGVFTGLPTGLSIWSVGLASPGALGLPTAWTAPVTYTIP